MSEGRGPLQPSDTTHEAGDYINRVQLVDGAGNVLAPDAGTTDASSAVVDNTLPSEATWIGGKDPAAPTILRGVNVDSEGNLAVAVSAGLMGTMVGAPVDTEGKSLTVIDFDINATSDGDNTIISATADQKIWVLSIYFSVITTAGAVLFKSAAGNTRKRFTATAVGEGLVYNGEFPFLICGTNEAFIINTAVGVDVVGGGIAVKVAD